ncbi:MAG: UDP-N-acetylmuramoyl-tripeptide--D-alanyl-D-alanine ligase [Gammaproteobacteria bacterium]|nr:UDP-N-acetylmuramoyl-tripeptide--D-alanyl-D-alanine ligase [Gammaproteobacteria bacterium]
MDRSLWSYRELTAALGLPRTAGPAVRGVAIDSRLTEPGDLFVALPGDPGPRFQATVRSDRDGHDFVPHAVENGAVAVLVHRAIADPGIPQLRVADTLDGLWSLGRAGRERLDGPVVAVTGSSGKTTFKSFAAAALDAFATSGSLNNHIGVPLSLARTPRESTAAIYEIGTNHPGEIEPLARLARPDVAVLLNVHPAHIENFGSLDAIREEKTTIAHGLEPGGTFVRPSHIDGPGRSLIFGTDAAADVRLVRSAGTVAEFETPAGPFECGVPGGGEHRAMSVCALAAVLVALDLPLDRLNRLVDEAVPKGRGNRASVRGITVIDESYNANPASMAATLTAFVAEPGRRIAILGDMLELGEDARRYHADLAGHCGPIDGVFCAGEQIRVLYDALAPGQRLGFADRPDAAFVDLCATALRPGDRVLVKASNGIFWANGFVDALIAALDRADDVSSTPP